MRFKRYRQLEFELHRVSPKEVADLQNDAGTLSQLRSLKSITRQHTASQSYRSTEMTVPSPLPRYRKIRSKRSTWFRYLPETSPRPTDRRNETSARTTRSTRLNFRYDSASVNSREGWTNSVSPKILRIRSPFSLSHIWKRNDERLSFG